MKKFIISEEESNKIKQMYGILSEQYYYFYGDENTRIYISNVNGIWMAYNDFGMKSTDIPKPNFEVPKFDELGFTSPNFEDNQKLKVAKAIASQVPNILPEGDFSKTLIYIDTNGKPKVGKIIKRKLPVLPENVSMEEIKLGKVEVVKLTQYYVDKEGLFNYWEIVDVQDGEERESRIL